MGPSISPYLYYRDAAAAIDELTSAFGFREVNRMASPDGRVWHAELEHGDGLVMLGELGADYRSPKDLGSITAGIYVYVDDVDAHFDRAKAEGSESRTEPVDQDYGDRQYTARDREGHEWYFATRLPEAAASDGEGAAAVAGS